MLEVWSDTLKLFVIVLRTLGLIGLLHHVREGSRPTTPQIESPFSMSEPNGLTYTR